MNEYLQQNNNNNNINSPSCQRIIQGVAKLSTFRIPSTHLKRCSEGALPINENSININKPKIILNNNENNNNNKVIITSSSQNEINEENWPLKQNLSPSLNNNLRVSSSGIDISNYSINSSSLNNESYNNNKRLYSLDSSTNMSSNGRTEFNNNYNLKNQQQYLVNDITTELRLKRRDKPWWNKTWASYTFLFISIILSLSVVIGVCLFLNSFIPKNYKNNNNNNIIKNNNTSINLK